MQTRRDQVQAHLFVMGRLSSAVVSGEPDPVQPPSRRLTTGVFAGLIIALLVVAGFAVYGLVVPAESTAWQSSGAVIVENETATRYVLVDGVLHPVVNQASALLIEGSNAHIVDVPRATLNGVPRGLPLGIPGAPDALPDPGRVGDDQWLLCSVPAQAGAAGAASTMALTVGIGDTTPTVPLAPDQGLLVRTPDGTDFLVWHDTRYRLAGSSALVALGYGTVQPLPVRAQWLDALPPGSDLAAPAVPGEGQPGPPVAGTAARAGEVFTVSVPGAAPQYFVEYRDGLHPVPQTVADLVLGDPAAASAYPGRAVAAVPVTAAAAAAAEAPAPSPAPAADLPSVPPHAADPLGNGQTPCARVAFSPAGTTVHVVLADPAAVTARMLPTTSAAATGAPAAAGTADAVSVAPGTGMLAAVVTPTADGQTTTNLFLVTGMGVKYPLGNSADAAALGYQNAQPVITPAAALDLLPTGPVLDRATALLQQPTTGSG